MTDVDTTTPERTPELRVVIDRARAKDLNLDIRAVASTLQIFDAKTFEVVKEAELGQRCWHFTYTPDGSKILAACGRSNDLRVIDAKDYTVSAPIPDAKTPWGVVTYPKGYGSLDTP